MERHLTKRQIHEIADKGLHDLRHSKRIERHLRSCEDCARRLEAARSLLSPRYRDSVKPSPELKKRIMDSYDSMDAGETVSPGTAPPERFLPLPAHAFAAAAVLVLVMAGGLLFYSRFMPSQEALSLNLKAASGTVLSKGKQLQPRSLLPAGTAIAVQDSSWSEMAFGSSVSITLFSRCSLFIEEAYQEKFSGDVTLRFMLNRGSLISKITHDPVHVRYTYETPAALILSAGTILMITADTTRSEVLVVQGSCMIRSRQSGGEIQARAGKIYMVEQGITERPAGPVEMSRYMSLIARAGTRAEKENTARKKNPAVTPDFPEKAGNTTVKKNREGAREPERDRRELRKSRRDIRESGKDIRKAQQGLKGQHG